MLGRLPTRNASSSADVWSIHWRSSTARITGRRPLRPRSGPGPSRRSCVVALRFELLQSLVITGKPEKLAQERQGPVRLESKVLGLMAKFFSALKYVVAMVDLEVRAKHIEDGEVWRRGTVPDAPTFQPRHRLAIKSSPKFIQQPGLADTGLPANANDLAMPMLRATETVVQTLQLTLPTDQRSQSEVGLNLQPGPAAAPTAYPEHWARERSLVADSRVVHP